MTTILLWAILLLAAAIAVIAIEIFVPSGGVLGVVAMGLIVASIVLMFWYEGFVRGTLFMLATFVIVPVVISVAIRYWPHTTMGRRILNLPPGDSPVVAGTPNRDEWKRLIGQRGFAMSKMLPSGVISVSGKSLDAVSQSGAIAEGRSVQIVSIDGTRILVRELDDDELTGEVDRIVPDPFEM